MELSDAEREMHALHGLASEMGEIHAHYQKVFQGHAMDYNEVLDEVGDLMWFIAELCDALGAKMESVASANIEKLKKRYPDGFSERASIYRER